MILALMFGLLGTPDLDRVVKAIEMVEASPWNSPGGGLQFTRAAWREMTTKPYEEAQNRVVARAIAESRLSRDVRRLQALKIEPTPYLLGSIWNKGFNGALALRRSKRKDEYGERVETMFHAYTK